MEYEEWTERAGISVRARAGMGDPSTPDEREAEVIEFAQTFVKGENQTLPRPLAAGMLFFRLDPGFRQEVWAAREYWCGSGNAPFPVRDGPASDQEWYEDDVLMPLAHAFAHRWGIAVDSAATLLATDSDVTYPDFVLERDLVHDETGRKFVRLDIHSAFVWREIDKAFRAVRWRSHPEWPLTLPDGPRTRTEQFYVGGGRLTTLARTVALHYLTTPGRGVRATKGQLPLGLALQRWREVTEDARFEGESKWRRKRDDFLGMIAAHRMDPIERVLAVEHQRHLDDPSWIALPGACEPDSEGSTVAPTWQRVTSRDIDEPWFWCAVLKAMPELLDDLLLDVPRRRFCQG